MAESLSLAAMTIDGGYADTVCAMTSSHFCSAERQFRLPLEYGGQRTPTAQWTVTGAGALLLTSEGEGPYVTHGHDRAHPRRGRDGREQHGRGNGSGSI